jgi:hypothetical protein
MRAISTTGYETRTERRPRERRVRDVTDADYGTVVEYVERTDGEAHLERTGERVLLVVA